MTDPDDVIAAPTGQWWASEDDTPALTIPQDPAELEAQLGIDPHLHPDGIHLNISIGGARVYLEHTVIIPWADTADAHKLLGSMLAEHRRRLRSSSASLPESVSGHEDVADI